ncbi:S41 family peptidase [Parasphingorhabdus cellanae]|uniref:Tail specific protease domain-containing protein n=1 Tax=Parasphingorhabdus cellanae TaxID=2806553 RepID=A0ABX7T6I6_9SPHN|nr:S41 family peptidase [Parasphingorhabdus cellanae]QTD56392.1 hypothetical protein J4G78_01960 [Parasphingorhabdus cellanae]
MSSVGASAQSAAKSNPDLISVEHIKADLEYLYTNLADAHYDLYAYRSEADYDAYYHGLLHRIDRPLDRASTAAMFQKFAAFGRIGHASSDSPAQEFVAHLQRGGRFVPLFARVEPDGRVLLTRTADADGQALAGSELVTIDDEPVARRLKRLGDIVSAEQAYMASARMEQLLPALLWLDRKTDDALQITLRVDGELNELSIPAVTMSEFGAIGKAHPTATLEADFGKLDAQIMPNGVAYLRPGPFGNQKLTEFVDLIDDSFIKFIDAGATDLILDLRNNPGGDNSFSDPLISWFADKPFRFASSFMLKASAPTKAHYDRLTAKGMPQDSTLSRLIAAERDQPNGKRYPFEIALNSPREGQRFTGRIWVLVNRHSYSNAASVAATIQDYGFGTVMGEETADLPTSFASIVHFTLPHSGFKIAYPKSYFVRPNGDQRVRGVVPDILLSRQPIGFTEDIMLENALIRIEAAHP